MSDNGSIGETEEAVTARATQREELRRPLPGASRASFSRGASWDRCITAGTVGRGRHALVFFQFPRVGSVVALKEGRAARRGCAMCAAATQAATKGVGSARGFFGGRFPKGQLVVGTGTGSPPLVPAVSCGLRFPHHVHVPPLSGPAWGRKATHWTGSSSTACVLPEGRSTEYFPTSPFLPPRPPLHLRRRDQAVRRERRTPAAVPWTYDRSGSRYSLPPCHPSIPPPENCPMGHNRRRHPPPPLGRPGEPRPRARGAQGGMARAAFHVSHAVSDSAPYGVLSRDNNQPNLGPVRAVS